MLTAEFEIWFSKYLYIQLKVCLVQAGDYVTVQQYVCVTLLVVQRLKWLRNTNLFTYLSVQRHAIHFSSTFRRPSIKWVRCIILDAKPSWFLCPPLPSRLKSPSIRRSDPTTAISPKLRPHSGRWPSPCTLWHCWFLQMKGMTDMFCWLHQVWLFAVASTLIQTTIRLLVVTECLSCLDTVNHKFSITHSAANWTSSATDHMARNNYTWSSTGIGILGPTECKRERRLCDK